MKVDHEIFIESEVDIPETLPAHLGEVISATLKAEHLHLPCEINVLLTDNEGIQQINLEQREIDSATDVLSFPMFELTAGATPASDEYLDPATRLLPLGDMVLSIERAEAQAKEFGHSVEREMSYLTVHSILHLLGYDHMDDGVMKAQMRAREEEILTELGITRD